MNKKYKASENLIRESEFQCFFLIDFSSRYFFS